MGLKDLDLVEADLAREIRAFTEYAKKLKRVIGELTPERRGQLDREHWIWYLKHCAARAIVAQQSHLPENVVEMGMALPQDMRAELFDDLGTIDTNELKRWFVTQHDESKLLEAEDGPGLRGE